MYKNFWHFFVLKKIIKCQFHILHYTEDGYNKKTMYREQNQNSFVNWKSRFWRLFLQMTLSWREYFDALHLYCDSSWRRCYAALSSSSRGENFHFPLASLPSGLPVLLLNYQFTFCSYQIACFADISTYLRPIKIIQIMLLIYKLWQRHYFGTNRNKCIYVCLFLIYSSIKGKRDKYAFVGFIRCKCCKNNWTLVQLFVVFNVENTEICPSIYIIYVCRLIL